MAENSPSRPLRVRRTNETILVIGLGRFGGNLALTLVGLGHQVMGIDADEKIVQRYSSRLTKTLQADTTNIEALRQLGVDQFSRVVVGVGDVEASILTLTELMALGVTDIWAKATTDAHKSILDRLGAAHVVRPEHDMGERVAHMVTGKMIDFIELDEEFALVETNAPTALHGRTLAEAGIRNAYGVTVVCIKPHHEHFTYATPETRINRGDILLVAGETPSVEAFAELD